MIRKYDTSTTIDGQPMLYPDEEVKISSQDLDSADSGRLENGSMQRVPVLFDARTFGYKYALLDEADYAYLKSLISGKTDFIYSFIEADGTRTSLRCYCSKHSVVIKNKRGLYQNLEFNIIDCGDR